MVLCDQSHPSIGVDMWLCLPLQPPKSTCKLPCQISISISCKAASLSKNGDA